MTCEPEMRPALIPAPETLISSLNAAEPLGIDRRTAAKLARAGLLGQTFTSDRGGILVRKMAVDRLRHSKVLVPKRHPPAFVVRLDAATEEEGEARQYRRFRGWHAALEDHPEAVAAWDRWWAVADPDAITGLPVVAVLGPIIVAVRTIDARPVAEFGRWRLPTTATLSPEAAAAFPVGHWLRLKPGATTAHLPDTRGIDDPPSSPIESTRDRRSEPDPRTA